MRCKGKIFLKHKVKNIDFQILVCYNQIEGESQKQKMRRVQDGKYQIVVTNGPPFPGLRRYDQDA
jgi:hypothetical protein